MGLKEKKMKVEQQTRKTIELDRATFVKALATVVPEEESKGFTPL